MKKTCVLLGATLCLWNVSAADVGKGSNAVDRGNYAAALAKATPLAEGGNRDAQRQLAMMYRFGRGVPVDYVRAFDWYRKAAMQGDSVSELELGFMYEQGIGVSQDYPRAMEWFHRAADKDWPEAELRLAVMYNQGEGVPSDRNQATHWLNKALQRHYAPAQAYAGYRAYTGQGEPQNATRAAALFRLAAYGNDPVADFYLGKMYFEGNGVAKDYVTAYALSRASCNTVANDPGMTEQPLQLRQKIEEKMSTKQLADAKTLLDNADRVGLINAIEDRFYSLTGKNVVVSDDPLLNTSVPSIQIQVDANGQVVLANRPIDEADLKERLQMFFHQSPRPEIRLVIDGDLHSMAVSQAMNVVLADIRESGLHDLVIETKKVSG